MPTGHGPARSLHSDEAVERKEQGSDCCKGREGPHEKKRKALKLPAEKGVRHELLQAAPADYEKKGEMTDVQTPTRSAF